MANSYPLNPNKNAVRWTLHCAQCKERVTTRDALKGNVLYALNAIWHRDHLNCLRCNVNLSEMPYCESKEGVGLAMCLDCYMKESNPKCSGCSKTLFESALNVDGQLYHKECFKCCRCKNICPDGTYMTDEQGNVYDIDCYHIHVLNKQYNLRLGQKSAESLDK